VVVLTPLFPVSEKRLANIQRDSTRVIAVCEKVVILLGYCIHGGLDITPRLFISSLGEHLFKEGKKFLSE